MPSYRPVCWLGSPQCSQHWGRLKKRSLFWLTPQERSLFLLLQP
ncbi:hypothetical protein [Fischerella sp. JS2]|nr:hypothetical protein [Fischerella sp. JS2]